MPAASGYSARWWQPRLSSRAQRGGGHRAGGDGQRGVFEAGAGQRPPPAARPTAYRSAGAGRRRRAQPRRGGSSPAAGRAGTSVVRQAGSTTAARTGPASGRVLGRGLTRPAADDQTFQQAVGRQPVGAVHAGAGRPRRRRTGRAVRCGRARRSPRRRSCSARPGTTGIGCARRVDAGGPAGGGRRSGSGARSRRCRGRRGTRTASPVARSRASIAAATTSRGARSPIGCTPAVTELPWRQPEPRPRRASPR